MDTGAEHRLQEVYGKENWLKLERAGLTPEVLSGSEVLEVCAGTGFLTYHLLQRCKPKHLIVNDKPLLLVEEERRFRRAVLWDAMLNHVLPQRCFGSICLVCRV